MKIFNFQIFVCEQTLEPNISEINSVIIGEPVNGSIEGVQFMLEYAGKILEVTQTPEEHIIDLVPDNCQTKEEYISIYQNNPYDGKFSLLNDYFTSEEAKVLEDFWLISIRPEFSHLMGNHTRLIEN